MVPQNAKMGWLWLVDDPVFGETNRCLKKGSEKDVWAEQKTPVGE